MDALVRQDPAALEPTFAIRRLWPGDLGRMETHLLRLDPTDRLMRFCHSPSDAVVSAYCGDIDWLRATVLGGFVAGELRAVAELIPLDDVWPRTAELALSVETPFQNRGIGSALLRHALVVARNRLVGQVYMLCLPENKRMQHIARKFGASLAVRDGQAEGEIVTPWPTCLSLLEEASAESEALLTASFQI